MTCFEHDLINSVISNLKDLENNRLDKDDIYILYLKLKYLSFLLLGDDYLEISCRD